MLRDRERTRLGVVGAFVVMFGLVMAGEYVVFRHGLGELTEIRQAGAALTLYFLESFLILILMISLVSFVASGLQQYYRARDTRLLLAAPVSTGALYVVRTLETAAVTSWALVILGIPALLALGAAYQVSITFYLSAAVTLALYAVLTGAAGALLTTVAGALLRRVRTRLGIAVAVTALLAAFTLLVGENVVPSVADFHTIFEPGTLNGKPASIKFIERKFAWWPSHPYAAALYASATGSAAGSGTTRTLLWLAPLAMLGLAATLGRALYARALPSVAEGLLLRAGAAGRAGARTFPRWLSGTFGALVERDLLAIVRSPHEISRAAFLAFLLILYTAFILAAPLGEVSRDARAVARLVLLMVVATGYFLTAFGLRFVYPSVSLEGRGAWALFASPVSLRRVFFAKFALYATALSVLVVPIAMLGARRLVTGYALFAGVAGLLVMTAVAVSAISLSAGAAWPNFREPTADLLATSGAGLASTLACLVYVAVMGLCARGATLAATEGGTIAPWLSGAAAVSAAVVAGALMLADRRLRTLEIA